MGPASDAGEEMTLGETGEIGWANVSDVAVIHNPSRNQLSSDEVAKPLHAVRVDLVVVVHDQNCRRLIRQTRKMRVGRT